MCCVLVAVGIANAVAIGSGDIGVDIGCVDGGAVVLVLIVLLWSLCRLLGVRVLRVCACRCCCRRRLGYCCWCW